LRRHAHGYQKQVASVSVFKGQVGVSEDCGAVMTEYYKVARDSPLWKAVCLHCEYHLACQYSHTFRGFYIILRRDLFNPNGVLFSCNAQIAGRSDGIAEVTIDMKWGDIESAGKDAWDEVQRVLRS
jgi:hypothetical protein